jgi:prolyl oligopeptidase
MEDSGSPEARAWLDAQAAHTRAVLDALPGRAGLLARIQALSNAGPNLGDFQAAGGAVFYQRRDPGANLPRLVMRTGADAEERTLLDPNHLGGESPVAINWYAPSWDARYVAYGISPGGSEDSTLHLLEVASGKTLDLEIPHVIYGAVNWLPDNQSFVYNRSPEPGGSAAASRFIDSRIYLHQLGTDPAGDVPVLGRGVHPGMALESIDIPSLTIVPDSRWMIALINHGDLREITLHVAPRATLDDPRSCPWIKVADVEDAVTQYVLAGDTLYLLSHKDAPRFQVLAVPLERPDLASATLLVPEGPAVIQGIHVGGDYLLTLDLDGGIGRIRRVRRDGGTVESVPLPFDGSIIGFAGEPESTAIYAQLTSWTVSARVYRGDAATGAMADTGWQPPSPVDFSGVEAHEVEAPARDGTLIPLSIIHRKGLALDGSHPTLVTGYGSYGLTIPPAFIPSRLAWYERGGVFAVAHLRGGGERGKEWHEAGRLLNKERTITDLIDCAEYLIFKGYTAVRRVAGQGGSAGGIPSGGALVRRPDLWGAMIMNVPVTNAMRSETTENGPPNVPEFGSVTTEDGFRGLQIIDSYQRVRDGVPYPAVMVTTGVNDPRVEAWMAMKMAARLQAATSSDKPVLLRVDYHGGHGIGSGRSQIDEQLADEMAFLLWQLGGEEKNSQ